jgi:ATP-dependent Zn protease
MLNSFNESTTNKKIILIALKSGNALSYRFVTPFTEQLRKITINDDSINKKIEEFIHQHTQNNYWEKKKIWVILFIVLLICLAIFFAGE